MKIDRAQDARRHQRYPLRKKVRAKTAGREFQGEVKDISGSGAALTADINLENNQFVELHVEHLDPLPGHIVRTYEKGFAVKFDIPDKDKQELAEELEKFRRRVSKRGA